ncbi:MAG: ATP-binding cassette domain-containing protein [Caldilineaceae bacterium]
MALIGPTGSGKSTIINLIPRFYDPDEGTVLVDGIDVRKLQLEGLRRSIGIVLRRTLSLQRDRLPETLPMPPDAAMAEIVARPRRPAPNTFIETFPEGYETGENGERGVTLSGGQKQRIAIARALVCDPASSSLMTRPAASTPRPSI